jgi:hypothetical protein
MTQDAAQVNSCMTYFVYQYSDPALRLAGRSKINAAWLTSITAGYVRAEPRLLGVHPGSDTAGESFELNISAAQKVGMLTEPVRAITLAQRSMPEK